MKASASREAATTKDLAAQGLEAVERLLRGFEAASLRDSRERGGPNSLRAALDEPRSHAYQGLLSVVLRLVFLLYAEDRELWPVQHPTYARCLSVKGLYGELSEELHRCPENMGQRFGAYRRLVTLFRTQFSGARLGDLRLPPRHGRLFDPDAFPFLEGRPPGTTAGNGSPKQRATAQLPSVDNATVYETLRRLLFLRGQRLSYASLAIEQLGSMYESLMGFHVVRAAGPAVRLGAHRLWVELEALRRATPAERKKRLQDEAGLSPAQVARVEAAFASYKENAPLVETLNDLSPGKKKERHKHRAPAGALLLQPGRERRHSGSHYTPRPLTERIVRQTLGPLLCGLGEKRTEEQVLSLKVCDPAMGSGAFLMEVVRQLASEVVSVWTRDGHLEKRSAQRGDPGLHARRLVAQRCVYGVDKNPTAVELAKLSLWLVTQSGHLPFTFLDHALRHGDSLVGLDWNQISSFHWCPAKEETVLEALAGDSLRETNEHHKRLLEPAHTAPPRARQEWRQRLAQAEQATGQLRKVADLCVGAFFSSTRAASREQERLRRKALVQQWFCGDEKAGAEVDRLAAQARSALSPFHWPLEFPEIFYRDASGNGGARGAPRVDAVVGNPPFLGGKRISTEHGELFGLWLMALHSATRNSDLAAHFFRRASSLLGQHGTLGLIASNTLSQGDTRRDGLAALLAQGMKIYYASPDEPWPGDATVTIHITCLAKGPRLLQDLQCLHKGDPVVAIDSRLRPREERPDPVSLHANADASFNGVFTRGKGFVLERAEAGALLERCSPDEREYVQPYLGGDEVNSDPEAKPHRYAIDVSALEESELSGCPALRSHLEQYVKPYRQSLGRTAIDAQHKKFWWKFAAPRPELRKALAGLTHCLVVARVTKHLCIARQPTGRLFSEQLYVFPLQNFSAFAALQSRLHNGWARLLSSTMGVGLRYSASDCFDPFPFPQRDPRAVLPELEGVGKRLHDARLRYMVETEQGLTKTYNALKDPTRQESGLQELRQLHEEMDRSVLRAYPKIRGVASYDDPSVSGWSDILVPPYCIANQTDQTALQAFESEVINRLFLLNELRARKQTKAPPPAAASGEPTANSTRR